MKSASMQFSATTAIVVAGAIALVVEVTTIAGLSAGWWAESVTGVFLLAASLAPALGLLGGLSRITHHEDVKHSQAIIEEVIAVLCVVLGVILWYRFL